MSLSYELIYHPEVKAIDIPCLNEKIKNRLKTSIELRLSTSPHEYGQPLRKTLKGYWKLRVGDYRVIYKIEKNEVIILGIIHRQKVYDEISKRL